MRNSSNLRKNKTNTLENNSLKKTELIIIIVILAIIIIIGIIIGSIINNYDKTPDGIVIINYNANGGTGSMNSTECRNGSNCKLKNNKFVKKGYKFIGWSSSKDETNPTYKINDTYLANSDITLYAIWELKEITITYDANGGTGTMENTTYKYGDSKIQLPENSFKKTGYNFNNWRIYNPTLDKWYGCTEENTVCDGTERDTTLGWHNRDDIKAYYENKTDWNTTNSEYDIIYYAQWGESVYEIKYELNGGISGKESPISAVSGSTITISNPSKEGFEFAGWKVIGTDATLKDSKLTIGTSDITLTANWKVKKQYLYNDANEFTSITGGWIFKGMYFDNGKMFTHQGIINAPTLEKKSEYMIVSQRMEEWHNGASGIVHMTNDIDLTNYNKLHILATYDFGNCHAGVVVLPRNANYWLGESVATTFTTDGVMYTSSTISKDMVIDISKLTGNYDIGIGMIGWHGGVCEMNIYEIYLD